MIDPVSAFSGLCAAHAAISKVCKMGSDLNRAQGAIMRYAKAEAELTVGVARAKKKRFGGIIDNALEEHFREEDQKRMKEELRSLFMLYGSPGQWERLQATIARARAERKKELELALKRRDTIINWSVGIGISAIGIVVMYLWVMYLKGW